MKLKYGFLAATATLLLAACSDNKFEVNGTIGGADEQTLYFEGAVNGRWFRLDSVKTDSDGDFSFSRTAPKFPEIYRFAMNGKSVYFPIDSLDVLTLNSNAERFSSDYELSGSDNAVAISKVDKGARAILKSDKDSPEYKAYKQQMMELIVADPSSIIAYYAVNKYIGREPLFRSTDKMDLRIMGAVANAFNTYRPNDPRTKFMVDMVVTARGLNTPADTLIVDEVPIIDITLQDNTGVEYSLADVSSKGGVVLLNFTTYAAKESPIFNKLLSDTYTKYKKRGLEIYQVAYDDNQYQWKTAAVNLPWITVYDPYGLQSRNLRKYNVGVLPTTFIIDRKGELVERVTDLTQLDKLIKKYL